MHGGDLAAGATDSRAQRTANKPGRDAWEASRTEWEATRLRGENDVKSNNCIGWLIAAVVAGTTATTVADDAENAPKVDLAIERKNAGAALVELGESAGIQIAVPSGISRQKQLGPITGSYTVVEALDSLLKDTGLAYHFAGTDSVAIGLDQDEPTGGGAASVPEPEPEPADGDADDEDVELIVVTGSRLQRQPGQMDRQVTVYDRFEIEASGVTTMEEFMRRIPQSFNAPSSNGAALEGNLFGSTRNYFGAAGVNLRGLGERATLILIDGRRTARGGVLGEATDINQIPISMIERVEVLFDGASAIYGADAVGGVVNVITRKDYQGVDLRLNHSVPQEGGAVETSLSIGGTHSWGSENRGSVTVSYEYLTRDHLDGSDRDLQFSTETSVDNPPYAWPPNIQSTSRYDFATGTSVPVPLFLLDADGNPVPVGDPTGVTEVFRTRYPEDADGDLTLADFKGLQVEAGSRAEAGLGLIPGRDDHAIRVGARQELSDRLEVSGAISLTAGDTYILESNQNHFMSAAPLNESPWGTTGTPHTPFQSQVQMWGEFQFLPDVERFTEKEALSGHIAIDGRFREAWEWEAVASHALSENRGLHLNAVDRSRLTCVGSPFVNQCSVDPRLGTLNAFHLPYFGLGSEEEFVEVFIDPRARTVNESTDTEYGFTVRGPLFKAPGGPAQSLVSISRRAEVTYLYDETGTPGGFDSTDSWFGVFPTLGGDPDIQRGYSNEMTRDTDSVSFELNVPLFGGDNARPGLKGLDVTFSARYDDVTSGGGRFIETSCCPLALISETPVTVTDAIKAWSSGFVWQPTDWLRFRANVNTAYAAPPLTSYVKPTTRTLATYTFRPADSWLPLLDENGVPITVDIVSYYGGNPELRPESNTTRSFGFDLTPEAIPNLVARVNFHWNELVDRIGELAAEVKGNHAGVTEHRCAGHRHRRGNRAHRVAKQWPTRQPGQGVNQRYRSGCHLLHGITFWRYRFAPRLRLLGRERMAAGGRLRSRKQELRLPASMVIPSMSWEAFPLWVYDETTNFFVTAPFDVAPRHRFDLRVGWAWQGWRVDVTKSYQSQTVKGTSRYESATGERYQGSNNRDRG